MSTLLNSYTPKLPKISSPTKLPNTPQNSSPPKLPNSSPPKLLPSFQIEKVEYWILKICQTVFFVVILQLGTYSKYSIISSFALLQKSIAE